MRWLCHTIICTGRHPGSHCCNIQMHKTRSFWTKLHVINTCISVSCSVKTSITKFWDVIWQSNGKTASYKVKEYGFLGKLHAILLMDNAVIPTSTRGKCGDNLDTLRTRSLEKTWNGTESVRTKFMTIDEPESDRDCIHCCQRFMQWSRTATIMSI